MSDFPPEYFHGRRYNAYNDWVKYTYGCRLQKISLDAGFTCPNRDGSRGSHGCSFCNNRSFTPAYLQGVDDIHAQIETGLTQVQRRYGLKERYVAYFQTYSNTYGSVERLRSAYQVALAHPQISGLVIGTRPDCLPDEVLDYLAELSIRTVVELEIGIESCDDEVLRRCNRGHSFEETVDAVRRAGDRGLFLTGHMLYGLPGETRETIQTGARALAHIGLDAIKFHQLQIVKGSQLANTWRDDPDSVPMMDPDTYLACVTDTVEQLSPYVKIQRLVAECSPSLLLSPQWSIKPVNMNLLLEDALAERGSWQGRHFGTPAKASAPSRAPVAVMF
ncbi:MAG: TIGR01212 family radical SAM protein [Rhodocyclaceae bacterium]